MRAIEAAITRSSLKAGMITLTSGVNVPLLVGARRRCGSSASTVSPTERSTPSAMAKKNVQFSATITAPMAVNANTSARTAARSTPSIRGMT